MTAFWYNLKFIKMAVSQTYFLRMCFEDIFIILDVMVDILLEVKPASAKRFLTMHNERLTILPVFLQWYQCTHSSHK